MICCTRAVVVAAVLALGACPLSDVRDEPKVDPDEPDAGVCLEDTNKPLLTSAGLVYNGTRRPSLVPLSVAQQEAVVGVSDVFSFDEFGAFCSGTLISDDVVLTAQHCTSGYGPQDMMILFGANDLAPRLAVASAAIVEHPTLDIAMVKLAFAPSTQIDVQPIAPAFEPPAEDQIGSLVENAGYGQTDDGSHGRYFVTEHYRGIYAVEFLVVDGEGRRGVCYGDSGGPSLHVSRVGDVRVLGALSFGDDPCGSTDYYQRVDTVLPWVEDLVGPTPPGEPTACDDTVTEQGVCTNEQTVATWCEGGLVRHDACGLTEICGDAVLEGGGVGKRCVSVDENPCGDVTFFGRCESDVLSWCDEGVVKQRPCGECQGRCLLADDELGFACVPSDCEGIDEVGTCDGTVSRWCEGTTLQSEDCAELGQACAYVGPELGYYCYDATACDGLTFYGECDGSVLRWCQDNEPLEYDCAQDGAPCGLVDEDTGYNCLEQR
jgi:Trypsin